MAPEFEGPFNVEGVAAYYNRNRGEWSQALVQKVRRKLGEFTQQSLLNLFKQASALAKQTPGNLFEAMLDEKSCRSVNFLSEDSLVSISPELLRLIHKYLVDPSPELMVVEPRLIECVMAGPDGLLRLREYLYQIKAVRTGIENLELAADELGALLVVDNSPANLVSVLPQPCVERIVERALPFLNRTALIKMLIGTDLRGWTLSEKVFRSLPKDSQQIVCSYLFDDREPLAELEKALCKDTSMLAVWQRVLSSSDPDVEWEAHPRGREKPASRDASPKRGIVK
jgi:hypothetical protein